MSVQLPIEHACHAPSAMKEGSQALGPAQDGLRMLPMEVWIIAAIYFATIGGGVVAAIKVL